ncbi:MAG: DNA-directed RNA polymerase subunit alpha [Thermoguttaceae bacterium]|nr:DNA-directed RNA polymerase subunit alpha [Thermoguttaceae bacterium]MBQ2683395.1 DNA-directed RNA polymerase subunit alpha [Thermoguttaceae bacterium]MBQ3332713.1 DNA-directed RNA polymerase subunit alpha [Thermoguttaceae bacterium]MBQ6618872.1 DNA-directed RNA polymerase subunit alpha [Thermoguttaceae bacterium]MBR2583940.1 DNA-directed RNA polymerase subunit alpha [Thermoguttaceae bacterium]
MRIKWRGLELPSELVCDRDTLTPYYGRFTAEPFERGFGVTVGNSLRRVLLSSLEGSAVTSMKLKVQQKDVPHEFTSVEGIFEDTTEIALNVKALVVRNSDENEHTIRIKKQGPCEVTAADIETDLNVKVINTDHHIATLTGDVDFNLEMVVRNGRGYQPASEQDRFRSDGTAEIGTILLDASFSPVVKVQATVEETRVGQRTNYDKLVLQIWTDGSVDPEMALVEAAKILRKHLNPFVLYDRPGDSIYGMPSGKASGPVFDQRLTASVTVLDLSNRAINALKPLNIRTVGDLVAKSEEDLLGLRNFGETTLNEVREKLAKFDSGFHLGMDAKKTGEEA